MAVCSLKLYSLQSCEILNPKTQRFNSQFQFQVQFPTSSHRISYRGFKFPNSVIANEIYKPEDESRNDREVEILEIFHYLVSKIHSFLPGGNWWNLCDSKERESRSRNSITVREALLRMWDLLGNEKWIMFVAFGSLIAAAVSEITMPTILATSIFAAESGKAMAFSRNANLLALLCFTSGISSGLRSGCFAIANVILVKRLRETLYSALIFQDIAFFDTEEVGVLTSRIGSDCQRLSHVIGNDFHLIVRNTLQGTGALINLLCLSWPLALSSLIICSVLAAIFLVYGRYQKMAAKLTQDFTAYANETADETLSLIRTVRVHGTERNELGRYKNWLEKLASVSFRESVAYGFWNTSFHTLYRSTQVFAVLLGGMSIMTGHVSTEQLTKYILYCEWLIYATWRVVDNMSSLFQAIGASENVFHLMQLAPSYQFLSKGLKLQKLVGQVHFVDVSFHYPSRPTVPILEHLNFSVNANEVVAVVGLSGSGKTTLVNLLLRLYEPVDGQIYIDGIPQRKLDMKWLKENIGYVEQEPQLFHTDIRSNITYGCPREIKHEEIESAAKLANAYEFISSLPDGFETTVDGGLLSGGQKQRIAIARAILRNPIILILDEATSALDPESEHYVKGILQALKNEDKVKRTVIVIAHRLSTINAADRIIVMDGGKIVEMGSHRELVVKNGLYSELIKLQTNSVS